VHKIIQHVEYMARVNNIAQNATAHALGELAYANSQE
jgi:hypothetical protein